MAELFKFDSAHTTGMNLTCKIIKGKFLGDASTEYEVWLDTVGAGGERFTEPVKYTTSDQGSVACELPIMECKGADAKTGLMEARVNALCKKTAPGSATAELSRRSVRYCCSKE